MNNANGSRIMLYILTVFIVISIAIFGITVYNGSKPIKLSDSDIKITEKPGNNPNEKIITVDAGDKVLFYSFDGGENFQTDNSYAVSENKSVSIVLQDNERRVIGRKTYDARVVADSNSPTIDFKNVPSEIKTGSNIDINSLVSAKDQNNNDVKVTTSGNIDTSKPGTYDVTYTATDIDGQTTTITTQVVVTDTTTPSTKPTKKTYYRYRKKTVTQYECQYYNCDYTNHNITIESTIAFGKDSYCCNVSGCTKFNPQVSNPCPSLEGYNCLMNMVPLYTTQGNVCYSREYITKNEPMVVCKKNNVCYYEIGEPIPNPGENYLFVDINHYNSSNYNGQLPICDSNGKCYVYIGQENPYDGYSYLPEDPPHNWIPYPEVSSHYKKECSTGEIKIDGYCHEIDSYGTVTCPKGYINENGTCYERVARTCSKPCENVSWSDWSAWSTTKVVPSDTVEVQTKVE